jgi:serine/threonine protein kinase
MKRVINVMLLIFPGILFPGKELGCANKSGIAKILNPRDITFEDITENRKDLINLHSVSRTFGVFSKNDPYKIIKAAVKSAIMKKEGTSNRWESLVKEIQFYRNATMNPNLSSYMPEYYGCIFKNGTLYMIIEYFQNGLQEYKDNKKLHNTEGIKIFNGLGEDVQLQFFIGIAKFLGEMHKMGIAHTNISPSKIFLRQKENKISPVLISFGKIEYFKQVSSQKNSFICNEGPTKPRQKIVKKIYSKSKEILVSIKEADFPKFDVISFALVIYQHKNSQSVSNCFGKIVNITDLIKFISTVDFREDPKFITNSEMKQNIFYKTITRMVKPIEEITITFPEIVTELERIRTHNNPRDLEVQEKKELYHEEKEEEKDNVFKSENIEDKREFHNFDSNPKRNSQFNIKNDSSIFKSSKTKKRIKISEDEEEEINENFNKYSDIFPLKEDYEEIYRTPEDILDEIYSPMRNSRLSDFGFIEYREQDKKCSLESKNLLSNEQEEENLSNGLEKSDKKEII